MRGVGRSLWVVAVIVGSAPVVRAESVQPLDQRFSFDCAMTPRALDGDLKQALADRIARKWNLGAVSAEAMQSRVTIRVCLSEDGRPEHLILLAADGPSKEAVDRLFNTARRAVNRAHQDGGLPLPPDKYGTWRVLDLVFDANGMRAR